MQQTQKRMRAANVQLERFGGGIVLLLSSWFTETHITVFKAFLNSSQTFW